MAIAWGSGFCFLSPFPSFVSLLAPLCIPLVYLLAAFGFFFLPIYFFLPIKKRSLDLGF